MVWNWNASLNLVINKKYPVWIELFYYWRKVWRQRQIKEILKRYVNFISSKLCVTLSCYEKNNKIFFSLPKFMFPLADTRCIIQIMRKNFKLYAL